MNACRTAPFVTSAANPLRTSGAHEMISPHMREIVMREPSLTVMRRSVPLWIGTGLLTALNAFVALLPVSSLTYIALYSSGAFALYGIGFGVWAGHKLSKP